MSISTAQYSGSSYDGPITHNRFSGEGVFTFPDGTRYTGAFRNGMFHGPGTLHFPGGVYHAIWANGKEVDGEYVFNDKLEYGKTNWRYCTKYDRRFFTEVEGEIRPAGSTQLVDKEPPFSLPPECFDVGDGYYDPRCGKILDYADENREVRVPDSEELQWITNRTRMAAPPPRDGQLAAAGGRGGGAGGGLASDDYYLSDEELDAADLM